MILSYDFSFHHNCLAPVLYQSIRWMAMLPQKLFGSSWVFIWNWPLYIEVRGKPKKKVDHSRFAGGTFIKQVNLLIRFVLSGHKSSRFPHLLIRTIEVYLKCLTLFSRSHIPFQIASTLHFYFKIACLEQLLGAGKARWKHIPRNGRGWGASNCPGPAHRLTADQVFLMASSNRYINMNGENKHVACLQVWTFNWVETPVIYSKFCMLIHFIHVWLFVTLSTVACQVPPSMGFSWQEHWSGLQHPPPGDLPDPGIKPVSLTSPALVGSFFTTSASWEAHIV